MNPGVTVLPQLHFNPDQENYPNLCPQLYLGQSKYPECYPPKFIHSCLLMNIQAHELKEEKLL